MNVTGRLSGVALERRDPAALAEFHLSFQLAPGHEPPSWPDAASSMQFHLHLRVDDIDAAEKTVLALGATKFDHQPNAAHSRVFADPCGPSILPLRVGASGIRPA